MTRCNQKGCGSYAFNLYKKDIDQGDLCDVHYWQHLAETARREALEEAIQACRDEENKAWALKGTRDWSSYIEGMSDGAGECADRIYALLNQTGEAK